MAFVTACRRGLVVPFSSHVVARAGSASPLKLANPWHSIRRQSDFSRLREAGRRHRQGPITVTFCSGDQRAVAMAIPKRVGNAVVRNRVRRRIRAILATTDAVPGMYLVSVAPEAATMTYQELQAVLATAVEKVTAQ